MECTKGCDGGLGNTGQIPNSPQKEKLMKFKDQLESAMKEQGFTKNSKAAERCEVSKQLFGGYRNGKTIPPFDKGVELLKKLNWGVIAFPEKKEL